MRGALHYTKYMKKILVSFSLLLCSITISTAQDTLRVTSPQIHGPYEVKSPIVLDSIHLDGTRYSDEWTGKQYTASFRFAANRYGNATIKVDGAKAKKVFINGNETEHITTTPGQYDVLVKYTAGNEEASFSVISDKSDVISLIGEGQKRAFSLDDNMEMKHYGGASLSPSGKYLIKSASWFDNAGKTIRESKLIEVSTGKVIMQDASRLSWMPNEDKCYTIRTENGNHNLYIIDILTGQSTLRAKKLPSESVTMSPKGDYVIYYDYNAGPKKQDGVFEVVHPDDRQPGYRGRYSLGCYNLATGVSQPLTFGYHSTYLQDISADGQYILFAVSQDSITQRPSELQSTYRLNLATMEAEQIISREGFVAESKFFPSSNDRIIIKGTPEAFGGIGKNLPDDMTPSMYDYQLFQMDIASRKVTPITKYFDPSIEQVAVSEADAMVYFTAANGDSVSVYRLNPKDLSITRISQPIEVVSGITIADNSPLMVVYGTSACVSDRIYSVGLGKKPMVKMIEDLNADRMAEIALGECKGYKFPTSRGYDVSGFYYLPADFDATKKYPVIVDYYGGCSPTSRRFGGGSHYPAHYWNALGYIVLIVNPSGAAGFGQEWAARHVNTAGEGVAEDIIEATEWFADNHSWVNKDKIGCVSASYGGFMTQTLLSKTDLYACGISHAGISSHTSYWGEGYWGYSYSEVSMANTYPWTRKDLYVDRSPIYNADKIHKPLLFTHGTADTNVPPGESIQMYTALKILGVPTAFVMVEGENHGIMDYSKRKKWINTMVAWFQRWLQDDDSWWWGMYPEVKQ